MNDKTILLVEDNHDDEALTLRALNKNNISNGMVVARDGTEALDYLHGNGSGLPALVLLEQDLINSYQIGANSYVRKPVDFEQVSEAVRQLGLYWLVLNESRPHRGIQ